MTINWFSSTSATASDTVQYYAIIQSAILSACPTQFCSLNFAAARVVRINWQNLVYLIPYTSQSIVSFYFNLSHKYYIYLCVCFDRVYHSRHIWSIHMTIPATVIQFFDLILHLIIAIWQIILVIFDLLLVCYSSISSENIIQR